MKRDFEFFNPTQVFFGRSAMENLGAVLSQYGDRVLLAYGGGSIRENGIYDQVMEVLRACGKTVTEFSGILQIPFADPELNWDIYFCCRKDYLPTRIEACFCQYILSFARDGADGAVSPEPPGWALDMG